MAAFPGYMYEWDYVWKVTDAFAAPSMPCLLSRHNRFWWRPKVEAAPKRLQPSVGSQAYKAHLLGLSHRKHRRRARDCISPRGWRPTLPCERGESQCRYMK